MLDYLAEVTMSIMQKQRARDPQMGYARDFVPLMREILPACVARNIRVTANAGGVNPPACAAAVRDVARELGLAGRLQIGIVTGDDILERLDDFLARGIELRNMDTGALLATVRDRIQSANVYLGAQPIVEALQRGADVVVTGRATDTGLTLAPLIHEFDWRADDWDRLAAGTIAGHIIECGAQCSGGNCQYEWQAIPDLANVGYPIVEASPDGTFVVTKHAGTGGRVSVPSVKEQLVYEMGDPHEYITPDCVADFTTNIAVVPVSAKFGEGIPGLLLMLIGLAQRFLEQQLATTDGPAVGTILEVKEEKGLGITLDAIVYEGTLSKGDTIVFGTAGKPGTTKVKALLKPKPLDEIRDPQERFDSVTSVSAAAGVKLLGSGLERAVAGAPLRAAKGNVDAILEEVAKG